MSQVFESISKYSEEHWIELLFAVGSMAIGWFLGNWRSRNKWAKKEFLDRLNISLNVFADGQLLIRTVVEKSCEEVFLSKLAVDRLRNAAHRTTPENPILELDKDDYWYYLNSVLNEISEKFGEGQVKRDLGVSISSATYVICLTSEAAGTARTRKIRAMMIKKEHLEELRDGQSLQVERDSHKTRLKTLEYLAQEHPKNPHKFLDVEVCV